MEGEMLISIVTPVCNEEENVEDLYNAVKKTMEPLSDRYTFELIYTDNHSSDRTFEKLADIAEHDKRVRVMRFSRNFGYQRSIATGYAAARGACAVQLDGDLQDPPSLIPSFIEHWEKGAKVVYGIRKSRQEGRLVTFFRRLFYRLINLLSEEQQPIDSGDFRLIDQQIIKELGKLSDSDPYLRGQIAAMGFKQLGIPYERAKREHGISKYPFKKMISLAD